MCFEICWNCITEYNKSRTFFNKRIKNIKAGISGLLGDSLVEKGEKRKIVYIDADILYGWSMSQYLPYRDIEINRNDKEIKN